MASTLRTRCAVGAEACGTPAAGGPGGVSDEEVPETIAPTPSVPTIGGARCTPVVQLPARVAGRSDRSADRHVAVLSGP